MLGRDQPLGPDDHTRFDPAGAVARRRRQSLQGDGVPRFPEDSGRPDGVVADEGPELHGRARHRHLREDLSAFDGGSGLEFSAIDFVFSLLSRAGNSS